MPRAASLAFLTLLAAVLASPPAFAEIYRYIDERGTTVYVDGLENVPAPWRSRAVPLGMSNAALAPASSVRDPSAKPAAAGATTIRYTPGQRIMVDARINGSTPTRLLLDTGADRTLISPLVLSAAGVSLRGGGSPARIQGVSGTTDAQHVAIQSLEVGEARVSSLQVLAHDMGQPGIDGLLGRDFLDQFKLTIDAATGIVTLAPK